MLKKKKNYTKYLCLLSQKFFPRLTRLDVQIRCAQNRYTAVQADLQYPMMLSMKIFENSNFERKVIYT